MITKNQPIKVGSQEDKQSIDALKQLARDAAAANAAEEGGIGSENARNDVIGIINQRQEPTTAS